MDAEKSEGSVTHEDRNSHKAVSSLPWLCPEHPKAQIRRSWDQTHYVMNGYPAGIGTRSNFRYECAECGLQLAPDEATS